MRLSAPAKSWGATTTALAGVTAARDTVSVGAARDTVGVRAARVTAGAAAAPAGRVNPSPSTAAAANRTSAPIAAGARRPRRSGQATGRGLRGCRAVSGIMIDLASMVGSALTYVKRAIGFVGPSLSGTVPHPSFS